VIIGLLAVAGLLLWVAGTLILDGWSNRRAERLTDRLRAYQKPSLADEAQRWLDSY
jgi:hypothetical protein